MPIDPEEIMKARRLLNQARLIAEASASQTSPIGHNVAGSRQPPGLMFTGSGDLRASNVSTLEIYGAAINRAIANDSNADLAFAIDWCERDLRTLTHSASHGGETSGERNQRICERYEGVLAGVVAREERMSVTMVRKIRESDPKGPRDPRLGLKVA